MENGRSSEEVGITKVLQQFIDANKLIIPRPIFFLFRYSGFFILAFLGYLIIFGLIDKSLSITWILFGSYFIYEIGLNILRDLNKSFYDGKPFIIFRIIFHLAITTFFIYIAPEARHILAFLYFIPIIMTIIFAPESNWLLYLIIIGVGLCLSLASFFAQNNQLSQWLQPLVSFIVLVIISLTVNEIYTRGFETPLKISIKAKSLYQNQDINKLLKEINAICANVMKADFFMIIVIDPDSGLYIHHEMQGFELCEGNSIIDVTKHCAVLKSGNQFVSGNLLDKNQDKTIYHTMFKQTPEAVIAEPIRTEDHKILGVMNIGYKDRKRLDNTEETNIKLLTTLASQAIDTSLRFRKLSLENARNQKAADNLMNASQEEDVMKVMAEKSLSMISQADAINIHTYDGESKELSRVFGMKRDDTTGEFHFYHEDHESSDRMRIGDGIAGNALFNKESIRVDDVSKHPWFWGDPDNEEMKSLLVAPLYHSTIDQPIGTISLNNKEIAAFTDKDEIELVSLANQGSIAISKFRDISRGEEYDSMLLQILDEARKFDISLPMEKFCQSITDMAVKALNFDIARIRFLDEENQEFYTIAHSSIKNDGIIPEQGVPIPLEVINKLLVKEYQTGRSYLIPHKDNHLHGIIDQYFSITEDPFNSTDEWQKYDGLITPLYSPQDNQLMGILTLDHPKFGMHPSPDIIEAIGSFKGIAEWAIELSQTYHELIDSHNTTHKFITSIRDIFTRTIYSNLDLVGWMVVQIGADLLSAEGCSLHLCEGKNLRLAYSTYLATSIYIGREKTD